MLANQEHVVLEQRRLHFLALARHRALHQRGHRADRPEHAAHDVVHARARAQWVARTAGHVGEAPHHLHHFIERGAVLIGAWQKPFVAHIDEARMVFGKRCVVETILVERSRLEVLGHHISGAHQLVRDFESLRIAKIDGNAFLVPVEHRKESGAGTEQMPRAIALDRFDLDDIRAQIGELARRRWPGPAHGKIDDAHALQRQSCIRRDRAFGDARV